MKKAKVVPFETLRPKTAVKDSRNFNHLIFLTCTDIAQHKKKKI